MSDGKCPDIYECRLGGVVGRDLHQAIIGKFRDELFEAIKTTQTLRKQLEVAREVMQDCREFICFSKLQDVDLLKRVEKTIDEIGKADQ